MPVEMVMRLILLISGILNGMPGGGPFPQELLEPVAHRLIRMHRANGVPVRADLDVFFILIPSDARGALGGSDCYSQVALSTEVREPGPAAMLATSTLAHEIAHTAQVGRCGVDDSEEAAEAAGYEALAKGNEHTALLSSIMFRLATMYYYETRDTAFLAEAGFGPEDIRHIQNSLKLMGEARYQKYYARGLPNILQAARTGRTLNYRSFDGRPLVLDDLGETLDAFGVIHKRTPPKAIRMAEMR